LISLKISIQFFFFENQNRAAQDRLTDQHATTTQSDSENNSFEALSQEKSYPTTAADELLNNKQQQSITRSSVYDQSSVREAFQRIKIAGDFQDMSHIEDLEDAVGPLLRAMVIREKYY